MADSVKELGKWMTRAQTDDEITKPICSHITRHGESTMVSLLSSSAHFDRNTNPQPCYTICWVGVISWKGEYQKSG